MSETVFSGLDGTAALTSGVFGVSATFIGAGGIDRGVGFDVVFLQVAVCEHPFFDFLAADIGEHVAVDLDAGRERLAAALLHFPAECRVFDDVLFLIFEAVFAHDGAHALAPAKKGFEVSGDFRG